MITAPPTSIKEFESTWKTWINLLYKYVLKRAATLTLTTASATTTVTNNICKSTSQVFLMPRDALAAAEFGNGTIYISTTSDGSFVITHANNANTRTFNYLIINE